MGWASQYTVPHTPPGGKYKFEWERKGSGKTAIFRDDTLVCMENYAPGDWGKIEGECTGFIEGDKIRLKLCPYAGVLVAVRNWRIYEVRVMEELEHVGVRM